MNDIVDFFLKIATRLAQSYIDGDIDIADFQIGFRQMLRRLYTLMVIDGTGGKNPRDIPPVKFLEMGNVLRRQYIFLEQFMRNVRDGNVSPDQILNRARMYVQASEQMYWRAFSDVQLPAYPRDGTCIVTPTSKILTKRGYIPIQDVVVGDMVYTHMERWRKVLNTKITLSENREWCCVGSVGFTTDHRLYTPEGWKSISNIDNNKLSVYTIHTILRSEYNDQRYKSNLMSILRKIKRLSCKIVPKLFLKSEYKESVGKRGSAGENAGISSGVGEDKTYPVGRYSLGFPVEEKVRWSPLHMVLGKRQETCSLPIPMGVVDSGREYTGRVLHTPQGRKSGERLFRKSGMLANIRSRKTTQLFGKDGEVDEGTRIGTHRFTRQNSYLSCLWRIFQSKDADKNKLILLNSLLPSSSKSTANRSHVSDLRENIQIWSGTWETKEILFQGVLPEKTKLYDLEVEEDHSFVVEGIVAHNSECAMHCACSWELNYKTDTEGRRTHLEATWVLGATEHCNTCEYRASVWNPLVIPLGV